MNDVVTSRLMPLDDDAIAEAARIILGSGIVAIPTETVYGLAGDATSDQAVAAIYAAKGRPGFNPLIVHVADVTQARRIGVLNAHAEALANAYWPGPLTLVVAKQAGADIATGATAGLDTVALRISAHPAMQKLLAAAGRPLAAPSANASGAISPTRADHVAASLGNRVPLIIDGGATPGGIESTVVAVHGEVVRLLRPGPVAIGEAIPGDEGMIESPGQLAAHYAPQKPLRLNATTAAPDEWLIGFGGVAGNATLSMSGDLGEAGARLYAALHEADAGSAPAIAVAPIPARGLGIALNDRLRRAATGSGSR